MVGRGLRIAPDKADCLVLDAADDRHDLVTLSALQDLGVTVAPAAPRGPQRPGMGPSAAEDPDDLPTTATLVATPRDLLTHSAFAWQRQSGCLTLEAGPGRRGPLIPEGDGYRVQAWAGAPVALHPDPLPLEYVQGVAEDSVRGQGGSAFARKDAKWRQLSPSASWPGTSPTASRGKAPTMPSKWPWPRRASTIPPHPGGRIPPRPHRSHGSRRTASACTTGSTRAWRQT